MHGYSFPSQLEHVPRASDPQQAADGIERWLVSLMEAAETDMASNGQALAKDPDGHRLLSGIFGNSKYLMHCAVRNPTFAYDLFAEGPDGCFAELMAGLKSLRGRQMTMADLARDLRRAKECAALAIAVADITDEWDVPKVTNALSNIAETTLGCACAQALREASQRGAFKLQNSDQPEVSSGLIVIGMGKLGARELNYSSDIDIIFIYDEARIETDAPDKLQKQFVRLARDVVGLMADRTADGYVFRTDLRLRPDPGSTPLAVSMRSALNYYEKRGRDWERAAMIKARAIAGDQEAGEHFLTEMQSFKWQRNLDFAAIKEIHTIKRQIDAHEGSGAIAVAGHNVKLGRGGIREIEFFTQAQQLLWAGRIPSLRCSGTIEAIEALVAADQLIARRAEDLIEAYYFLRRVEHRLQMINDEQTQTLPQDEVGLSHLAIFLGYEDVNSFKRALLARLKIVEALFIELFEISLVPVTGDIVLDASAFSGSESSPATLTVIEKLGFSNPHAVAEAIRHWYKGDYDATSGERARHALTELVPMLLKAFGSSAQPDWAFQQFNVFLSQVPSEIQLLSMLHANPQLIGMSATIMGSAPELADYLSRYPSVLESVLIYDFFDPLPEQDDLGQEINERLEHAETLDKRLELGRRWANDRRFQVAVQILGGLIEHKVAAIALSNIAEASIKAVMPHVGTAVEQRYGQVSDAGLVVIDTGDLGAKQMTWTSRLKPILVYGGLSDSENNRTSLSSKSQEYFRQLSELLIDAISARTIEGVLYGVEMRPHPSGNSELVGWSVEEFCAHFSDTTSIPDLLALLRARVVAGPPALVEVVQGEIHNILTRPQDEGILLENINKYRTLMYPGNQLDDVWAMAGFRRRLADLELVARYLQLRHAANHPEILEPNIYQAFTKLREGEHLHEEIANDLISALELWQAIYNLLQITLKDSADLVSVGSIPDALKPKLEQIADVPDFDRGADLLRETYERVDRHVRSIFQQS